MTKLPPENWSAKDAPPSARTTAQRRKWTSIVNLAWRMNKGDDQFALAVADSALRPEFWDDGGEDFLTAKWNRHFATHTEIVDGSESETTSSNDSDGLDEMQRILAGNDKARQVIAEALDDVDDEVPEPLAIVTLGGSTNLDPIRLVVVNERHEDTAADRGLKLYEDTIAKQNEMRLLYDQYDSEIASKYLEGK